MYYICEVLGCTPKEFTGYMVFFGAGFLGMVAHWAKKWLREQTKSSLFRYLFVSNVKYTASSVLSYFGAMAIILAVGDVDYASSQYISISFLAGYMIDSAVNKDV